MTPGEILSPLRVANPPAPYGVKRPLRRNRAAFDLLEFLPTQPRDVSHVDTATTVLGHRVPLPFALSPIGGPRMFHHEGELAVARAVRHYGISSGLSTLATASLEDVAAQPSTPLWFQLYVWGDRALVRDTASLISP